MADASQIGAIRAARLYSVARALTSALTGAQVAEVVFRRAQAELGACSVGLWMVETGTIRFVGGAGATVTVTDALSSMAIDADLPAAQVIRTGQPILMGSRDVVAQRWPNLREVRTVSDAIAVLPLSVPGRTLGCLHVGYPTQMTDDDFDRPFLEGLAELTAAALDRAQLHDTERARQSFLLEASAAVSEAVGYKDTLERLAAVAVPTLADLCLIDVREGSGAIRRMAATHADPAAAPLVDELLRSYPPEAGGEHPASQAMDQRRSKWAADISEEFLRAITRDARHLELTRLLRFTSYMCVPLIWGGQVLGAITLVSAGSGRRFGQEDLALAEDLAARAAAVVASARRHEREHELAHALQQLLLPAALPSFPGLEVSARYLTAHSDAEAGGDFYDLVTLPSGRAGFVIGDVEGHDAAAAATMGQLRSALRALAGQHHEPAAVMDALRWSWDLLGYNRIATCIIGRFDPATGEVVMTAAGHLPPVVVEARGPAVLLDVEPSPPLGATSCPALEDRLVLAPGDTLFLYTDGLVENREQLIDDELEVLRETLERLAAAPLDELCDEVISSHAGAGDRPDDIAVLALRRVGPPG